MRTEGMKIKRSTGSRTSGLGLLVAVLFAAPALAATDAEVQTKIEARLAKARTADIQVQVENGAAHLRGTAQSLVEARAAERAARKEAKTVVNEVRVLPERRSEAELRKDAERAVLSYPYYEVFDAVGVEVADGVATLRGWVLQPWRSSGIEELVARVKGLRELRNEIQVQSASELDGRLRRELYARIYGNQLFETYARQTDKPVRIIVDRGRIILAGTVGSVVEQTVAGNIARSSLGFAVDNQVQVSGRRPVERKKPTITVADIDT